MNAPIFTNKNRYLSMLTIAVLLSWLLQVVVLWSVWQNTILILKWKYPGEKCHI